jgi:hypothetical protein
MRRPLATPPPWNTVEARPPIAARVRVVRSCRSDARRSSVPAVQLPRAVFTRFVDTPDERRFAKKRVGRLLLVARLEPLSRG